MGLTVARLLLARARSLQPTWWRGWPTDARQGAGSCTLELARKLARAGKGDPWPAGVQSAWPGARRPGLRARLVPRLVRALVARSGSPLRADRGCTRPSEMRLWIDGPKERRMAEGLAGDDLAGGRKGRERRDRGERKWKEK